MTHLTPELEHELNHALKGICKEAGLVPDSARLIKYTNNAVYRLPDQGVVVRFGVGNLASQRAEHVVRIAEWLEDNNAPTAKLAKRMMQPIIYENYAATLWEELTSGDPAWSGADLAKPLLEFHRLTPPHALKDWDPFSSARSRLAMADGLAADDHAWLVHEWEAVETAYRDILPSLRVGLLHGDAYIGNLLREPDGRFVLCDFDGTSIGPIEYDLVVAAVSADRFGFHRDHRALAESYGIDVTERPSWPILRRIRELVLVTSVIPNLRNRPEIAAVHAHRLSTLRSGERELWQRYR